MPRNHYIILGVSRQADLNKIKKAYRKIAKQYHPDITQSDENTERFREIKDAYETLTNEEKRRQYDIELNRQEIPARIHQAPEYIREQRSYRDDMSSLSSFVDEFLEGMVPGFIFRERFRSPSKDLYLEAILTPLEAREGGLFPIQFPVIESCPRCHKTGYWEDLFCPVCHGYGHVKGEREFSLSMPPNIPHGTQIRISLEDIGMTDVYLNLLVYVDKTLKVDNW